MDFLTKIWTFGIVGFLQSSLKNKCNLGSYDPVFLLRRNSIGMTFWLLLDAFYERFFDLFMYPLSTQFPAEIGCCFCMQVRNFLFLLTVEVFQVILQLDLKLLMWFEEIRCLCNKEKCPGFFENWAGKWHFLITRNLLYGFKYLTDLLYNKVKLSHTALNTRKYWSSYK